MRRNLPVSGVERVYRDDQELISSTDLKGHIQHANDAFLEVSGFRLDELIGKAHNIIRHPDMPPAAFAQMWQTLKAGRPWLGLVKNRCKNGDHYWVDAFVTPTFDGSEAAGYESVRRRPSPEQIARTERLYRRLSAGRSFGGIGTGWSLGATGSAWCAAAAALVLQAAATTLLAGAAPVSASIVLVLALVAAWPAARRATLRLRRAADRARTIVDDPLASYAYTGGVDEVGRLELASHLLTSKLRTILARLNEAAGALSSEAERTATASRHSVEAIERQQAETVQVAAAMEEMAATVKEVARSAASASDAAHAADRLSRRGGEVVGEARGIIHTLSSEVGAAADVIRKLAEDSRRIGEVLDVIRGIADQTGLLALNAAIEAARAGEQGRGFAVVADEVRTLAGRTQASTKDIEAMIETLQSTAQEAVTAMQRGSSRALQGVEQADRVASELTAIATQVSTINDMNAMIAAAAEEQSSVSATMSENIHRISLAAEQTSGDATATSGSSAAVAHHAGALAQMLLRFRA